MDILKYIPLVCTFKIRSGNSGFDAIRGSRAADIYVPEGYERRSERSGVLVETVAQAEGDNESKSDDDGDEDDDGGGNGDDKKEEEKKKVEYIDHSVVLTGFGVRKNEKYWKIKNSWGPTWGEDGHGKIIRNVSCLY